MSSLASSSSLRARLFFGIAIPILIILFSLSYLHFQRERRLHQEQLHSAAEQLAALTLGSLRHAMLVNDRELLNQVLLDVNQLETVRQIQILDNQGRIKVTGQSLTPEGSQVAEIGCQSCHGPVQGEIPQAVLLPNEENFLRISTPINNEMACRECHASDQTHLGILMLDVTMGNIEEHLRNDLQMDLLFITGSALVVALGFSLLIHWLILKRVEAFRGPLSQYAAGDFSVRLKVPEEGRDELDDLAYNFNQMADTLETYRVDQEGRHELRERAIIEERERIARELHDGVAQLLGFVNTKAMAIRVHLKKRKFRAADTQLQQLETASRELFVETREAILGLKLAGEVNSGLASMLENYVEQYCRLCEIEVDLTISSESRKRFLSPEIELQLIRIVQEALTNVRKHAQANKVRIGMKTEANRLTIEILDDGVGFNPDKSRSAKGPQFGLAIMKERAEAIGAAYRLYSQVGEGTRITLTLDLDEEPANARPGG